MRFFHNHGMLTLRDRPQWRTVAGGSRRYVEALSRRCADRIRAAHAGRARRALTRRASSVTAARPGRERFDEVVFACHGDQALALLADPSAGRARDPRRDPFQPNEAVLHTDASLLPRRRAAWAAWNYHLLAEPRGRRR